MPRATLAGERKLLEDLRAIRSLMSAPADPTILAWAERKAKAIYGSALYAELVLAAACAQRVREKNERIAQDFAFRALEARDARRRAGRVAS
jgi:hypothetical protein